MGVVSRRVAVVLFGVPEMSFKKLGTMVIHECILTVKDCVN